MFRSLKQHKTVHRYDGLIMGKKIVMIPNPEREELDIHLPEEAAATEADFP